MSEQTTQTAEPVKAPTLEERVATLESEVATLKQTAMTPEHHGKLHEIFARFFGRE